MPAGMIIRDANNNVVVDTSTRLSSILGFIHIGATGSLADASFAKGTPFAVVTASSEEGAMYGDCVVSFSGITMIWTVTGTGSYYITYGVY